MQQKCTDQNDQTVAGLLEVVRLLVPTCDQRRAAIILAATVNQLSQTFDYRGLLTADSETPTEGNHTEKDYSQWN